MKQAFPFIILSMMILAACTTPQQKARMRQQLEALSERHQQDTIFTATEEAKELAEYFNDYGSANEQILANYLVARAYHDSGEAPMAIHYYQEAVERADTTATDCDYRQLSRVYGQMSSVFYQQNLLDQALECDDYSIRYGLIGKDTLNALLSMGQKTPIYRKLHKTDLAIENCKKVTTLLKKHGYNELSAGFLSSILLPLIEEGRYEEVRRYMDIYESNSGYFDLNGNIEKGREVYYYMKGLYYLHTHRYDSAEYYLRKELSEGKDFNNQEGGSRGLSLLFMKTHYPDSSAKYALYSYDMLDSTYARMATSEVERMKAVYDYTRNQKLAHQERIRANHEARLARIILLVLAVCITGGTYLFKKERNKRLKEHQDYIKNVTSLERAQSDLIRLHSSQEELDQMIAEREKQIEELNKQIDKYQQKEYSKATLAESLILKSEEYQHLKKLAAKGAMMTSENWHEINEMVIKMLPNFYRFVSSNEFKLNDKQFKTCILIRLHFSPTDIAHFLGVQPSYITKIRNQMMKILFGEDGTSKELDAKLLEIT